MRRSIWDLKMGRSIERAEKIAKRKVICLVLVRPSGKVLTLLLYVKSAKNPSLINFSPCYWPASSSDR
jgi:hypothetical protein